MSKLINIIATCAENGVIGHGGKLPWKIAEDTKLLHARTAGQICLVGRRRFETWPRATFDGRQPVVLTSRPLVWTRHPWEDEPPSDGPEHTPVLTPTLTDALIVAETLPGEIFVCGGRQLYAEALTLPLTLRLHLTLIHAEVPGDTFFPEWRQLNWCELTRQEGGDGNYHYTFLTLESAPAIAREVGADPTLAVPVSPAAAFGINPAPSAVAG